MITLMTAEERENLCCFGGSGGKIKRKEIKNGGTEINSCGLKDVRKDLFSDSWCVQS